MHKFKCRGTLQSIANTLPSQVILMRGFSLAGQKIERLECLSLAVCQLNGRLAGLISGQIPTLWFLGRSNLPAF